MYIIGFITVDEQKQADKISKKLLDKKLVACVSTISDVSSMYWWQGRIEKEKEILLMFKSRQDLFPDIVEKVKKIHTYDVPEIIAMPIIEGNPEYLEWLEESLVGA